MRRIVKHKKKISKKEYEAHRRLFIGIAWLFFIVVLSITLYDILIKSSVLSVQVACGDISLEELKKAGYIIAGKYYPPSGKENISNLPNISIYVNDTNRRIEKHEYCHFIQHAQNRNGNCSNRKLIKFINELECKSAMYLPDKIYNKLYPPQL